MAVVLVATENGCKVFVHDGECETELAGRHLSALAPEGHGACLAVVDAREIWRRNSESAWSIVTTTDTALQSIVSVNGIIFAGAMDEAAILRICDGGEVERPTGFDSVAGREEWFAGGPSLGVRSLTATADGAAILAAVHVGGIPRSSDMGGSWAPTIPILFDVHEVCAHPRRSNVVVAATAVGLCVSEDAGRHWTVLSEGLEGMSLLAAAVLPDEMLFSVQDGPFAKRSQLWRWRVGGHAVEQVRDGLPEWLDGKVDTGCIAASAKRAAVVDGGGNLWLSETGSGGWVRIASDLPYTSGLLVLD